MSILPSSLAAAINSTAGGFVTAAVSGTTINLTSTGGGIFTDWGVSSAVTYDTADFSAPSYTATTANMSGGTSSTGSVVYGFDIPDLLGYAPNGNLLLVNDSVIGNWTYGYDNLNRLVSGFASSGPYHDTNSAWTYDGFGNRTSEISPISNSSATYTYGSNQVASSTTSAAGYLYDAAGDVQYDGLNYYLYDAEGRVCAVKNYVGAITGYIYDAAGIRVSKVNLNQFSCNLGYGYTPTSSYVLGLGGEQITEFSVTGGTSTWAHTNVFNGGGLLATYSPTGDSTGSTLPGGSLRTSTYFALNDWLGTKRAEVGANGCVSTYISLQFSNGLTASGNCTDPTEHHFTGKERDNETGNDYFAARYYNSNTGRWMSPDWSVKEEPVPYAQLDNPQTLNLYGYVGNNPPSRADADGHCPVCLAYVAEVAAGAAIGAGVGAVIEVASDLISGQNVTMAGIKGAAADGAITGAVTAGTEGASLFSKSAYGAGAAVIGGLVSRHEKGEKNTAGKILTDAAAGAAGPTLSKAGKGVGAWAHGSSASEIEGKIGSKMGARHARSLEKQAAAAASAEKTGAKTVEVISGTAKSTASNMVTNPDAEKKQ